MAASWAFDTRLFLSLQCRSVSVSVSVSVYVIQDLFRNLIPMQSACFVLLFICVCYCLSVCRCLSLCVTVCVTVCVSLFVSLFVGLHGELYLLRRHLHFPASLLLRRPPTYILYAYVCTCTPMSSSTPRASSHNQGPVFACSPTLCFTCGTELQAAMAGSEATSG